ncbi:MAG: hypothetical protein V1712_03320 [Patescibacteria group bacterium]
MIEKSEGNVPSENNSSRESHESPEADTWQQRAIEKGYIIIPHSEVLELLPFLQNKPIGERVLFGEYREYFAQAVKQKYGDQGYQKIIFQRESDGAWYISDPAAPSSQQKLVSPETLFTTGEKNFSGIQKGELVKMYPDLTKKYNKTENLTENDGDA